MFCLQKKEGMAVEVGVICHLHCLSVLFVSCCPWWQLSKAGRGCLVPFCFPRINRVLFIKKKFQIRVKGLKGVGVGYKLVAQLGDLKSDTSQALGRMDIALSDQVKSVSCLQDRSALCLSDCWHLLTSLLLCTRPSLNSQTWFFSDHFQRQKTVKELCFAKLLSSSRKRMRIQNY